MPSRFHFDLTNGSSTLRDEEGVFAKDLSHATKEALIVLEELRASDVLLPEDKGWKLVIRDAEGAVLRTFTVV